MRWSWLVLQLELELEPRLEPKSEFQSVPELGLKSGKPLQLKSRVQSRMMS